MGLFSINESLLKVFTKLTILIYFYPRFPVLYFENYQAIPSKDLLEINIYVLLFFGFIV